MSRVEEQWEFLKDISRLIIWVDENLSGVMLTAGEFYESPDEINPEHLRTGRHPDRQAADLNLFINSSSNYITGYHPMWDRIGNQWKAMNPKNRWGGDFASKDYNHFERAR